LSSFLELAHCDVAEKRRVFGEEMLCESDCNVLGECPHKEPRVSICGDQPLQKRGVVDGCERKHKTGKRVRAKGWLVQGGLGLAFACASPSLHKIDDAHRFLAIQSVREEERLDAAVEDGRIGRIFGDVPPFVNGSKRIGSRFWRVCAQEVGQRGTRCKISGGRGEDNGALGLVVAK
jgi:hypothetical protein